MLFPVTDSQIKQAASVIFILWRTERSHIEDNKLVRNCASRLRTLMILQNSFPLRQSSDHFFFHAGDLVFLPFIENPPPHTKIVLELCLSHVANELRNAFPEDRVYFCAPSGVLPLSFLLGSATFALSRLSCFASWRLHMGFLIALLTSLILFLGKKMKRFKILFSLRTSHVFSPSL